MTIDEASKRFNLSENEIQRYIEEEKVSAIYIPQLVVEYFEEKDIINREVLKARKKYITFEFAKNTEME